MGFHSDGPDILRIRIERDDGTHTSMTPVKIHRGQIGYLMVVIDGRLHQRTFQGKGVQDEVVNSRIWSYLHDNLIYEDPLITGDVCRCTMDCFCIRSFYNPLL